jgi:hypothetical protein
METLPHAVPFCENPSSDKNFAATLVPHLVKFLENPTTFSLIPWRAHYSWSHFVETLPHLALFRGNPNNPPWPEEAFDCQVGYKQGYCLPGFQLHNHSGPARLLHIIRGAEFHSFPTEQFHTDGFIFFRCVLVLR